MRRVLVIEADETARRELLLGLRQREIEADAVADGPGAVAVLAQLEARVLVVGPGAASALPAVLRAARQAAASSRSGGGLDTAGRRSGTGVGEGGVLVVVPDSKAGWDALRAGAADFVPAAAGLDAIAVALRKIDARIGFLRAHDPQADTLVPPGWAGGGPDPAGRTPPSTPERERALGKFVGTSAGIVALLRQVHRFAPVASAVLIGGESGTGKELIARALHDLSPWQRGPFVPVNCGAIPAGLMESELFGHERGAFTDAVRDKRGLFEVADGGTLFLDEIADLPLALQAKLLRVLQDGMVRRVGSTDDVRVQARVLAATARDLAEEVRAGRFREDFYYRLAGLELHIPPLRERREDIPRLAHHFLEQACRRLGLGPRSIDPEAMRLLVGYPWPGNARELENTIERAAVLCSDDRIDVGSLPERVVGSPDVGGSAPRLAGLEPPRPGEEPDLSIKRATREIEEHFIRRALAQTRGNRVRAAELLEISHRALLYKIKDYAIEVDSAKRGAGSKAKNGPGTPPGG